MDQSINQRSLAGALFLVTLATVMFQVLLTRIFSVTMWYHFAFMAISMAMFGMTLGALLVFLRPRAWPQATLLPAMGRSALFFAVSMAAVMLLHSVFYLPSPGIDMWPMFWTFAGTAVPFAFSGIFVCLALTRFPARIGQLYAIDLAGAAIGCLCVIVALHWLDGVGAVLCCAALAALGAALMLRSKEKLVALAVMAALAAGAAWSAIHLARYELAAIQIRHTKGFEQAAIDYERWNSFSRIAVLGEEVRTPAAWSLSRRYRGSLDVPSRWLQIDAAAGTQLVRFDGDLAKLEFLRWDLTNFVHHLRHDARVCIVGAGGGRDVLAAKLFGQKRVVAVEINANIMRVANQRFGEYTGHLDRDPRVRFVNDEARSYLAREAERFDIVQLTFIDTWAATAAGAYVLTENSLYTVQAWKTFLERLDDDGLLSVSRGVNAELGRLVALGREALRAIGAEQPERHIVVLTNRFAGVGSWGPMGLVLVRKTPFTPAELAQIRGAAERMDFAIELAPGAATTRILAALASGRDMQEELAQGATNFDAPTDDQPFFFNMIRPSRWMIMRDGTHDLNNSAVIVLIDLLAAALVLVALCMLLPLPFARVRLAAAERALLWYFAAIGAGFMLIEISMMQRLIVFLGHPIYSLSVILFVLLLASGVGSRISARIAEGQLRVSGLRVLALLAAVLIAVALATRPLVAAFEASDTPTRIAVSAALLALSGLMMGMAFPLGMRLAAATRRELAPWLWGVNGAMSVLASVAAVVIAMAAGISASFWSGVASYGVALVAFALAASSYGRATLASPRAVSP